jgi:N6-L-threonylcarbamoyladenine synthase
VTDKIVPALTTILAIESTCDETAAAVVADGVFVRSNVVASQVALHEVYKGVVPELASRAHIEQIIPVIQQALHEARCTLADIDAIAVAQRPGLIGSLLIGVTSAKTLAWALNKPIVGVDHVQAHLYSVEIGQRPEAVGHRTENARRTESADTARAAFPSTVYGLRPNPSALGPTAFPAVGLVCSGGHTALYLVRSWTDITLIGRTIDDAVGEAYDKVAAMLGLAYPGGKPIDDLAQSGNPKAVRFPRSTLGDESLDFSFSGLKTAVLYHVRGKNGRERDASTLSHQALCDVCASFQQACIDVLLLKIKRAMHRYSARSVIVGGGVSANRGLRSALSSLDVSLHLPQLQYCTDNAAMIGGLAYVLLQNGHVSDLSMDAVTHSALTMQE